MILTLLAITLSLILTGGIICTSIYGYNIYAYNCDCDKGKEINRKRNIFILIGANFIVLLMFIFIPFSFHTVQAGEVAVVKHLGQAVEVRTPGTYFDFWVIKSYDKYNSKVQSLEIETATYSNDGQTMDIALNLQYQIDATKALQIANNYGTLDILNDRIKNIAIESSKSILSAYSAMTVIETRATISLEIEQSIKDNITDDYFIHVNRAIMTDIEFTEAFERIVEEKMIAEQERLRAEYEKETAIINAEKDLAVAILEAAATIEKAKGDAAAEIEAARAIAESIKLRSIAVARTLGFTITERILIDVDGEEYTEYEIDFTGKTEEEIALITEYLRFIEYLAVWDGKLPDVIIGDGDASIIIPLP